MNFHAVRAIYGFEMARTRNQLLQAPVASGDYRIFGGGAENKSKEKGGIPSTLMQGEFPCPGVAYAPERSVVV